MDHSGITLAGVLFFSLRVDTGEGRQHDERAPAPTLVTPVQSERLEITVFLPSETNDYKFVTSYNFY